MGSNPVHEDQIAAESAIAKLQCGRIFWGVVPRPCGTHVRELGHEDRSRRPFAFQHLNRSAATGPFGIACTGTNCLNGINIAGLPSPGAPAFPDYNTIANRVDASAKYILDPTITAMCGWIGETFIRVRYLYEQNKVSNWQNDLVQVYLYAVTNSSTTGLKQQIFMAGDNPNYTAQAIVATFGAKW
jgi:Putative outer membrane beta-barrel porin, MtrB/PioB